MRNSRFASLWYTTPESLAVADRNLGTVNGFTALSGSEGGASHRSKRSGASRRPQGALDSELHRHFDRNSGQGWWRIEWGGSYWEQFSFTIEKPGCNSIRGSWSFPNYSGTIGWAGVKPCEIPSGESTAFNAWWKAHPFDMPGTDTIGGWKQTLLPSSVNFGGRTVQEQDGNTVSNPGTDSCWRVQDRALGLTPATQITGGEWAIYEDNSWGDDLVGWVASAVNYYRQQGRVPCSSSVTQNMAISCNDIDGALSAITSFEIYRPGVQLGMDLEDTRITSRRGGQAETRVWP